ncbi:MAG: dicarboxylate/amino acid:cation symporter [Gemmatimonadetes bacterium]|nr:dicarboxylate/amino acid:cation symporter [Gemmatimonadota bacterium]
MPRQPRAAGLFSPTARAFWGLLLGLALGAIATLQRLVPLIEPVGTLWINAIRMTVIPLVVSLLVTGVASAASAKRVGRLGAQSVALFLVLLIAAAAFTAVVAPFAFRPLVLDPASTAALRASAHLQPANAADISWRTWLVSLIPVNPIKAAADGTLLPVIVFTVTFAFALTRLEPAARAVTLRFFEAILEALLILIRWILKLTPLGVFALAFVVSARLGSGTLGAALGYYVGLAVVLALVAGIGLYLFATIAGRVSLRTFARAVFPAQVVGFTSRSSLTALPALIEGARDVLHLPAEVTGFVLPFAISVFKFTSPIYWTLGAQFVAQLYGIDLAPSQLATVAAASILLNASTPGIPSGGLLIQAPIYAAIGLPVEGIGILIAIDAIPDMFKSALILASDMTVAVIVARWSSSGGESR